MDVVQVLVFLPRCNEFTEDAASAAASHGCGRGTSRRQVGRQGGKQASKTTNSTFNPRHVGRARSSSLQDSLKPNKSFQLWLFRSEKCHPKRDSQVDAYTRCKRATQTHLSRKRVNGGERSKGGRADPLIEYVRDDILLQIRHFRT